MAKERVTLNLWLPAIALIALMFANNWAIPLWNADEAAYAGLADTMKKTGDWMTQKFFWSEIHRKPPLHLWLTAISMSVFGSNEFAVRFFSSAFMLVSSFVLFKWVSKHYSQKIGLLASLIFCTNFLCLAIGKIGFTDSTLLLFQVICGLSLFELLNTNQPKWRYIFWASFALGILTKGPQIFIPFTCLLICIWLFKFDRKAFMKLQPWFYLPLSILPIFVWGYFSWQQDNGEFVKWLLDWYLLRRIGGSVLGQSGPPGYYLIVLLATFSFFLVGFVGVLRKVVRRSFKMPSKEAFLILWALSAWIPFEIIPSKLPHYASGALPPLAILIALSLHYIDENTWKQTWTRIASFVQIILGASIAAALVYLVQEQFGFQGMIMAIITGLVAVCTSIAYIIRLEMGKFENSPFWLAGGALVFGLMLFMPFMNVISPVFSCPKEIAQEIDYALKKDDKILLAKKEHHMISLPFYLTQAGKVTEVWRNDYAHGSLSREEFKAVVGDSILASDLKEDFNSERYRCYDMNQQKYVDFYVMIKK